MLRRTHPAPTCPPPRTRADRGPVRAGPASPRGHRRLGNAQNRRARGCLAGPVGTDFWRKEPRPGMGAHRAGCQLILEDFEGPVPSTWGTGAREGDILACTGTCLVAAAEGWLYLGAGWGSGQLAALSLVSHHCASPDRASAWSCGSPATPPCWPAMPSTASSGRPGLPPTSSSLCQLAGPTLGGHCHQLRAPVWHQLHRQCAVSPRGGLGRVAWDALSLPTSV